MTRVRTGLVAALSVLFFVGSAHASDLSWLDQCAPGGFTACASVSIGLQYDPTAGGPYGGATWITITVSNLQGTPGFTSLNPSAIGGVFFTGFTVTDFPSGRLFGGEYDATYGEDTPVAIGDAGGVQTPDLSAYSLSPGSDAFRVDLGLGSSTSMLFGCDYDPAINAFYSPSDALHGWTCGGKWQYRVLALGNWEFTPSTQALIGWSGETGGALVTTQCTMGVDCATVTPEPATIVLLTSGLMGLWGTAAVRRRRFSGRPTA